MQDTISSDGVQSMPLSSLSEQIQVSCQTLVRWIDRHLVDAQLGWDLADDNTEVRTIAVDAGTVDFLKSFAQEYRKDTVSRPEARRLLKKIDPRNVKRLIRAGDIETLQVGEDTRILIGSIEDYLIDRERSGEVA